jgi:hypothetical protein
MKKSIKLLAERLNIKSNEVQDLIDSGDYLLLTDAEADEKAREFILDSVWAFNASFLAAHAVEGVDEDAIKAIQSNNRCESNNSVLLRLIADVDHFVSDAIASDGRGHFMSSYDGEEIELRSKTKSGKALLMFAYRLN